MWGLQHVQELWWGRKYFSAALFTLFSATLDKMNKAILEKEEEERLIMAEKTDCVMREQIYDCLNLKKSVFFWSIERVGVVYVACLSPPFKGFERKFSHLQHLQRRADWVADEPVNYWKRLWLFVRQRLEKREAF